MRILIAFSLTILLTQFVPQDANAQTTNTWKGGTPGQESNWACSKNWSLNRIPDAFHHVVISDVSTSTGKYPVIIKGEVEVLSLKIETGASLTLLPQARLFAEEVELLGTCKGCQERHVIEGNVGTATALATKQR
jgi:hypothetical protein